MKERTLALTGPDVEKLGAVLANSMARYAIEGDRSMEDWCRELLARLQEA